MTGKGPSRRNFLKASAGAVGVGLMAACAAPGAPAGEEMAEDSGGDAAAMERVDVHCNLAQLQPTEWTTRSAEHPLVGNAARILAERFEEINPDIAVVFDESGDDAWLTAAVSSGRIPRPDEPPRPRSTRLAASPSTTGLMPPAATQSNTTPGPKASILP